MTDFWQLLVCFVCLLMPAAIAAKESPNPTGLEPRNQPNILFLFTDDQSFETIGSLGLTDIETPAIDRLVRRGTLLTHAYNMGSWSPAVCVASRTMLITGRSIWDAQRIHHATDQEREAGLLWPQLMKQAGYETFMTGKWHIQTDAARVFDLVRDVRGGMPRDVAAGYNRPRIDVPDRWSPSDPQFGGFWEGGRHWTEVAADHACDYLNQRDSEAPFFMYVAFNAPHDPRQAPQEFVERYPLSRVEVPRNFLPLYPFRDEIGCSADLRDEKLGPFPRTEHAVRVHRQEYYAAITHLDSQIGRILDALDASGKADNTWIFLTADHGLAVGHHGLFGKQNLYDHSVRVPLVVVGPGVAASRRVSTPVYLQDVMATSLELANAHRPDHVFFRSLLPLLHNPSSPRPYSEIYGAYLRLQRSITVDQMKLIAYPKADTLRLYDLANDPLEMNDLAAVPARRAQRDELFQRLIELQKSLGDQLDLTSLAD
ncbi:MAG: sulfatase-like hydrolase/transferase [Planctomycetota bacterium]